MKVLAIDTSTAVTAVAVLDGNVVRAQDNAKTEQRHGDVLLPRVQARVKDLLGGYPDAASLRDRIEDYIVAPALGDRAGVLGADADGTRFAVAVLDHGEDDDHSTSGVLRLRLAR